ncbi:MAG TPA: AI-2E family transporter [Gaiellaceae bacterium]|nr:AI-2E family transporter [Gaiellaceae bacterium]
MPTAPSRTPDESPRVAISTRSIVVFVAVLVGALLALVVAWAARTVLVELVMAIVLAMAAEPFVQAFERRGLSRGAAIGVTVAGFALALVLFLYLLFDPLVHETTRLVHDSPRLLDKLSHGRGHFGFLEEKFSIVERVQSAVQSGKIAAAAGPAWGVVSSAVHTGGEILFVLFLAVFVQLDGRRWFTAMSGLLPGEAETRVQRTGEGIARVVGGYVTGNLLISVIAGTVAAVTCWAVGVPYPVALGMLVAITDLVPLVGATIGTVGVAAVALATEGIAATAVVVAVLVVYQQVENHVLQQLVYHRTVKLSPLAIAVSVAAGAELGGVVGVLLAIPFAGALNVVSTELLAWRRERGVAGSDVAASPERVEAS